jgi:hypothetical protein
MEIDEHLQQQLYSSFNPPLTVAYNSIPHHEKENPKSLAGHLVCSPLSITYNRLLPLNAYPYTVEAAFACEWRLLKRGESNLSFLFVNKYSYPLLCYLHLCWFIAGRWIGYNVIYTVGPHKNVKNINSAMPKLPFIPHYTPAL